MAFSLPFPPLKRYRFAPILGWSASRYDVFSTCKRKYYYAYYSKYDTEFGDARIKFLKGLTTEALAVGILVHDLIAEMVMRLQKSRKPVDRERLKAHVLSRVEHYVQTQRFFELHYKTLEEVPQAAIQQAVLDMVFRFLDSLAWQRLHDLTPTELASAVIEPEGFGETRVGGLKAYCKVDFLIPNGEKVLILDWKTGKKDPEKFRKQLLGYALFATENLGVSTSDIEAKVVFFKPEYEEVALDLRAEEIANFIQVVGRETQEMYAYTLDIENNLPRDKEQFEMLREGHGLCAYCEYKELCGR
ncbi:MAG: PD-(D/E)XK nuclease family protein [Bacteroidia bacterium]